MILDKQIRKELQIILDHCIEDTERELYLQLLEKRGQDRTAILAELDLVQILRGKINGRLARANPAER